MAVMAALPAIDCPVRVTGLLPMAENAVGANSMRPGDVLTHCYRPFPNSLLRSDGGVREEALIARVGAPRATRLTNGSLRPSGL